MTRSALPGLGLALAILAAGLITAFTVGRYPVSLAEHLCRHKHDKNVAAIFAHAKCAGAGLTIQNH